MGKPKKKVAVCLAKPVSHPFKVKNAGRKMKRHKEKDFQKIKCNLEQLDQAFTEIQTHVSGFAKHQQHQQQCKGHRLSETMSKADGGQPHTPTGTKPLEDLMDETISNLSTLLQTYTVSVNVAKS